MENTAANSLYDLLVTRDFDPEILDSSGKAVTNPVNAELFSFDWKSGTRNYGTVVILLGDDNNMEVYFGDNLGRSMDAEDKGDWYDFLGQLKQFATRNLLQFELNNLNRLKYTMQGMAALKEGLFEGYYGRKNISYHDEPKKTRLMIKHTRNIGEGEARYRAVESLFVETAEGERFKLPFRNLTAGRAMARHVSEGGTPYDAFGQHIATIVDEMTTLSRFIRAAKNKQFSGDTGDLVEAAIKHYRELKDKAKRMISRRGYSEEISQFDPAEISQPSLAVDALREMFIEQMLDQRIEEALPILAKLSQEDNMKEANQFESWINGVMEGTWAVPETKEQQAELKKLLSQPLIVGPDAINATEQLYDLVGDDELFDQLAAAAEQDPKSDVRKLVIARLEEMGIDTSEFGDQTLPEELDTDGVMMTRPSNMSSEGVERLRQLARL